MRGRSRTVTLLASGVALLLGYMTSTSLSGGLATVPVTIVDSSDERRFTSAADDRAGAFVARAVASTGLAGGEGPFFDYLVTESISPSSWKSTFDRGGCPDGECDLSGENQLHVTVEHLAGELRVSAVEGPVSEDERAKLLLYQDQPNDLRPGWSFPAVEVDPEMHRITGSPVWEGPANALGLGSKCSPRVVDDLGQELWKGPPFDLDPPGDEAERAGGTTIFSVLSEELRLQTPDVECETWRGRGWTPAGSPPQAKAHDDELGRSGAAPRRGILVTSRLGWDGPAFVQAFTQCRATLRDDQGDLLGDSTETFVGPPPEGATHRPAFTGQDLAMFVTVREPGEVARAEIGCELISADEFQQGG